jgi:hypothetical protein
MHRNYSLSGREFMSASGNHPSLFLRASAVNFFFVNL